MEDGAIKGKNNVKMGHGKQFLRMLAIVTTSGSGPRIVGVVGYLVVCQEN